MGSPKKFKTAVLGGTFDRFHKGHKSFLNYGLSISQYLIVGGASDEFVKKFKIKNSQPKAGQPLAEKSFEKFSIRKKNVENYLNQNAKDRYEIVKIEDMLGTTLSDTSIDAIVVSRETLKNAKIINIKRKEKNLPPLEIIIAELVLAQDGKPISSFRIRNGEINRSGKLYIDPSWFLRNLYLPVQMRKKLKSPWGQIFKKIENVYPKDLIITVGDETTKAFNNQSIKPNLSVIDFKVAREWKFKNLRELGFLGNEKVYKIKNPAGSVSGKLFKLAADLFKNIDYKDHRIIQIDGEEDLSVLPLILTSPLDTNIFYGQPGRGIVRIIVDEKIRSMLNQFITRGY